MVKIVADENIPFLKGVLEPFASMVYLPGHQISNRDLTDADGLITRSRTRCDSKLLEGTPVRFIATATIGYDHIDTEYCDSKGISWHYAEGCNASGVHQYVAAALLELAGKYHLQLKGMTLGVIGVGNIGTRIVSLGELLGMNVLQNDPPRERQESTGSFVPLEYILEKADIISLHVPITFEGPDKTFHLADSGFFGKMKQQPFLVNSSRGEVINGQVLKEQIKRGRLSGCVLDVWENEPEPDRDILRLIDIGTPHIAGYSTEGKAKGTAFCVQQASRFLGFGIDTWFPEHLPSPGTSQISINPETKTLEAILQDAISFSYSIMEDDSKLRERPDHFENLRNEYPVRREFQAFTINLLHRHPQAETILEGLGFKLFNC